MHTAVIHKHALYLIQIPRGITSLLARLQGTTQARSLSVGLVHYPQTDGDFPRNFGISVIRVLLVRRLVSSPTRNNEASSSNSTMHGATFAVRVGTIDGVITHHLRAETRRDLAAWARAIVQGCHTAAQSMREYTVREYLHEVYELSFDEEITRLG